ncbi:MAG: alpha/beta hydrolase [Leptolyngbyaceae cyanobacterium RM1_406_9]|nr:alpha/beta hydrolase [Leptolyngbyaceae cyanobacterium RM1_406_9]
MILGISGATIAWCTRASAVETVKLIYETDSVVVPLSDIRAFAETGQPPAEVEQFLLDNGQPAEIIARLLTEEITLSGTLRERIRADLEESSVGQFILYEIDKIIQGSGDLTTLKAAIDQSVEDRKISILELLENYTSTNQVSVDLVGLRQTYTDVKAFVERVIPALEVAREYLQDVVCDCETAQSTDQPTNQPTEEPIESPDEQPVDPQSRSMNVIPVAAGSTAPCNPVTTAQPASGDSLPASVSSLSSQQ